MWYKAISRLKKKKIWLNTTVLSLNAFCQTQSNKIAAARHVTSFVSKYSLSQLKSIFYSQRAQQDCTTHGRKEIKWNGNVVQNYRDEYFESFSLYFAGQLVTVRAREFTAFEIEPHLANSSAKTDIRETRGP